MKINEMVFAGPTKPVMHIGGEMAMAKVPAAKKPEAPQYDATAVADKHFADYLQDKSNSTVLEKKMLKVIADVKAKKEKGKVESVSETIPSEARNLNNV
jgi:hypothetical protein